MNFDNLTPEQMEKVKACKSADEQLSAVSGGGEWYSCETLCGADQCAILG